MRTIWKYSFIISCSPQQVGIPEDSEYLHVEMQGSNLCLWALVEPSNKPIKHDFMVYGTGFPIEDGYEYVGTGLENGLVWHLFEIGGW